MKILVACEESQAVCIELRNLGHEAYSCDIVDCSGNHPEWHIKQDVLPILNGNCYFYTQDKICHSISGPWDMIIAFPPCTHLATSGAKYFEEKIKDGRQQQGIDFFLEFTKTNCDRICIENPVGIMSTKYRKPDQIIQPFFFGDPEKKTTCLWLKGLPKLIPTKIVEPRLVKTKDGYNEPLWHRQTLGLPNEERARLRSKTFPGIAQAMATQFTKNTSRLIYTSN